MQDYNKRYRLTPNYSKNLRRIKPRYQTGKSHALKRGLSWSISVEEFIDISKKPCYYCNTVFNESGSGLDRKDPKGPYSLDNVLRCCGKCNYLKNKYLSVEEMQAVVQLLTNMRGGKLWSVD